MSPFRLRLASLVAVGAIVIAPAYGADDLTQPRSAAKAFTAALARGDADAAKAASIGERQDMQFIDAISAVVSSRNRLNIAADAAFGPTTQPIAHVGPTYAHGPVDNTVLKIEGDTATLSSETGLMHMRLRKIDAQQWRVDLKSTRGGRRDQQTIIAQMEVLAASLDAITECIKSSAYGTRDEAQRGMLRLIEMAGQGAPTTAPSQISPR